MDKSTCALTIPCIDGTKVILFSVTADTYDEASDAAWMLWSDPKIRDWALAPCACHICKGEDND